MNELLKQIKTAGIILRRNTPNLKEFYYKLRKYLQDIEVDVLIEENSALMIKEQENIVNFDEMCKQSDFLISVGGDGTLLSVARRAFVYDIAVLGINLGNLGFLTDINPKKIQNFLSQMKQNNYVIDSRIMLEASININSFTAFNDIVIQKKSISGMVKIDAKVNTELFNTYYADGLIISTPTGSSAYNMSCGGPIVYPLTDIFILTPISPHSLTQRPLILPSSFELQFSTNDHLGAVVVVDGQEIYEIKKGEPLKIKIASKKAKLIHSKERDYFKVLNDKLGWGEPI